jgi:hypothetical protein
MTPLMLTVQLYVSRVHVVSTRLRSRGHVLRKLNLYGAPAGGATAVAPEGGGRSHAHRHPLTSPWRALETP